MYPFIHLFGRDLPTYGLLLFVGLTFGTAGAIFSSRSLKLDVEYFVLGGILSLVSAFVGAKTLFLVLHSGREILGFHFRELFLTLPKGFSFYGGLLGAIFTFLLYCKAYELDSRRYLDAVSPGIAIALGWIRMGCLCAGCCYGKASTWGLSFKSNPGGAPEGIKLYPVQVFETVFAWSLAALLIFVIRKQGENSRIAQLHPYQFAALSYALFRFGNEFLRAESPTQIYFGFSTGQWISLMIGLIILIDILCKRRSTDG